MVPVGSRHLCLPQMKSPLDPIRALQSKQTGVALQQGSTLEAHELSRPVGQNPSEPSIIVTPRRSDEKAPLKVDLFYLLALKQRICCCCSH